MHITILFIIDLILYNYDPTWSLQPITYIIITMFSFQFVFVHHLLNKLLDKQDIYVNCSYIIGFLYTFKHPTFNCMLLFNIMSDYVADTIILKKTFKYLGADLFRGSSRSAGLDIKSPIDIEIKPSETVYIDTNILPEIPDNYFGMITDRSSMAKKDLKVLGGIIDSDFRGEIVVMMRNNGKETYQILKDDRIAQIICIPYLHATEKVNKLSYTLRNIQGFGHSGR